MSRYKLWNCRYSFDIPSDIAGEKQIENYVVAARNYTEAVYKGNICLLNNPAYISLNLTPNDVKPCVREIGRKRIKMPLLSIDEDKFEVSAKLSKDSKSLEFLVKKK